MARLRNPLKTARGLGSAKSGTDHFIHQRLTAVALVFSGLYVLALLICNLNGGYDAMHAALSHVGNAVVVMAFVIALCWHATLGVQVVIEDYVHTPSWSMALMLMNRFVFAIAGVSGVLAVLKIALGATGN